MGTELQIIAHIESGFTQKFGIPRQSGLVADTTARISAILRHCEELRASIICGFSGDFPKMESTDSPLPSNRPGLGEGREWACLPPDPPTGRTISACPR